MQGRLLVAYSNASNFVSTTAEISRAYPNIANLEVRYVHVTQRLQSLISISTNSTRCSRSYCRFDCRSTTM